MKLASVAIRAAISFAAAVLPAVQPAQAQTWDGAAKLRRLEIMLAVTGERCGASADDFTADYQSFAARQGDVLAQADAELFAAFVRAYGPDGALRAFDRQRRLMAENYAGGHPWLSCAELGLAARNLAQVQGRATLEEAADQLLTWRGSSRSHLSRR